MILNNKGITITECLIAILLTAIGIVALMPMQDLAIKTISRSDFMGRAQGVLQSELESQTNSIMWGTVPAVGTTTKTVYASSDGPATGITGAGDASFKVDTRISVNAAGTNSWIINVTVTWPANTTCNTGDDRSHCITSSMIASQL